MKINQIKIGSIISYLQIAAGIVIGLLYTPVMIRLLGDSEYGLYNTAVSTISMLSVLSLGFNSGYIRFFSKYKKENDVDRISSLNGMFLLIFIVIGLIALICGLFLSSNLDLVFDQGLTEGEFELARSLMVLLTFNLAISFPMSVFSNIISANEKFVLLKMLGLMKTVVSPLVTLPLLLVGFRSVAMVAVTILIAIITDIVYVYYVVFYLQQKFIFKNFETKLFKELFCYISFIAINIIVDQINWNIDKLLLARYKGTYAVAVYSVGYTLFSYYMTFSTAISGLFTPRVHNIVRSNCEDADKSKALSTLFIKVGRIQFIILGLVASGLVAFGHQFIVKIWSGERYSESYYVMILLVLTSLPALIQNIGIEIQRALNKHKFRSIVYAIMAVVNLIVSIYLCQRYGATGSAIGTAFSLIVCNAIIMNIYYAKACKLDIASFWKEIALTLKGFVLPIVVAILMHFYWEEKTVFDLLFKIATYTVVYCISMWCFSMNDYEKNLFKKPIFVFVNKQRKS